MKKILITTLAIMIIILPVFLIVKPANTENVSYYSGDAISYQSKVFVASTDSAALEVFTLENDYLKSIADIRPIDERFNTYNDFYSVKFNIENGGLYVYATSDFSLYKYRVNNLSSLELIQKVKNNSWEWYSRVDKIGDNIVTIGPKGIKIWNSNMDIIDGYDVTNEDPYNIQASESRLFIFSIAGDSLTVFDRSIRQVIKTITLNYKEDRGNHKVYYNPVTENIFAVDDFYAKKYDLNGELVGNFRHLNYNGYDIDSTGNEFVYFSNGLGVVKLNQADMALVNSQVTAGLGGTDGWAMGIEVVATNQGDRVVVFNHSNILVLDQNLNKLAYVKAGSTDKPVIKENLWLNMDSTTGAANSEAMLYGGGFSVNESLEIALAGETFSTSADSMGRFEVKIIVPEVNPVRTDIKVMGQESNLSYSIAFDIQ